MEKRTLEKQVKAQKVSSVIFVKMMPVKPTFMLKYSSKAYEAGIKEKTVEMAINGSGIWDTSEGGVKLICANLSKYSNSVRHSFCLRNI